jgi:hypothetical protein
MLFFCVVFFFFKFVFHKELVYLNQYDVENSVLDRRLHETQEILGKLRFSKKSFVSNLCK